MKKVFSILTMVLIAALLVVSCDDAAKLAESNLVNLSVAANGAFGKVVTVDNADVDYYAYKLEYKSGSYGEAGFGDTTSLTDTDGFVVIDETTGKANEDMRTTGKVELGLVSQGYWKITIAGFMKATETADPAPKTDTKVSEGTTTANIDKKNRSFSLTLQTKEQASGAATGTVLIGKASNNTTGTGKITVSGNNGAVRIRLSAGTAEAIIAGKPVMDTVDTTKVVGYEFASDASKAAEKLTLASGRYLVKVELQQSDVATVDQEAHDADPTNHSCTWTTIATQQRSVTVFAGKTSYIEGTTDGTDFVNPDGTVEGVQKITGNLTVVREAADENDKAPEGYNYKSGDKATITWKQNSGKATTVEFYINGVKQAPIDVDYEENAATPENAKKGIAKLTGATIERETSGAIYIEAIAYDAAGNSVSDVEGYINSVRVTVEKAN